MYVVEYNLFSSVYLVFGQYKFFTLLLLPRTFLIQSIETPSQISTNTQTNPDALKINVHL